MRRKQLKTIVTVVAILIVLAGVAVLAVSNYGSQSDPLVSMSYITDTLTPSLQAKFNAQLKTASEELQTNFADAVSEANGGYTTIKLTSGQKIVCSAGSEILLVSGSVQAITADTVSDVTDGKSLAVNADLVANHLYLVNTSGLAVTSAGESTLMVRGTATVS